MTYVDAQKVIERFPKEFQISAKDAGRPYSLQLSYNLEGGSAEDKIKMNAYNRGENVATGEAALCKHPYAYENMLHNLDTYDHITLRNVDTKSVGDVEDPLTLGATSELQKHLWRTVVNNAREFGVNAVYVIGVRIGSWTYDYAREMGFEQLSQSSNPPNYDDRSDMLYRV